MLEELAGRQTPPRHALERGRLIDAIVNGHKYIFDKKAIVYGEEDLVTGLVALLAEIGIEPVLCASGGRSGNFEEAIAEVPVMAAAGGAHLREVAWTSYEIAEEAEALTPDLLIGNSKGYHLAKQWGVPLIRVGFPIHDRFGGQRILPWVTEAPSVSRPHRQHHPGGKAGGLASRLQLYITEDAVNLLHFLAAKASYIICFMLIMLVLLTDRKKRRPPEQ